MDRVQIALVALAVAMFAGSMYLGGPSGGAPLSPAEPVPGEAGPSGSSESASGSSPGNAPGPPAPAEIPAVPSAPSASPSPKADAAPAPPIETTTLSNGQVELVVTSAGGRIVDLALPEFADRVGGDAVPVQLVTDPERGLLTTGFGPEPWFLGLETAPYELLRESRREVVYRTNRSGVEIVRTLRLDETGYGAELAIAIANRAAGPVQPRIDIELASRERPADAPDRFLTANVAFQEDGSVTSEMLAEMGMSGFFGGDGSVDERATGAVDWVGVGSQYFLVAVVPDAPELYSARIVSRGRQAGAVTLEYPRKGSAQKGELVPPGQGFERVFRLYLGPKIEDRVAAVDDSLLPSLVVGWAWVRPLVVLFAASLTWIYDHMVANYGIAIILITIFLRLVTFPLTQSSMKSMKRVQEVAPQMKEIQEKFKNDAQRLQQEMMALYKRTGVNPLTSMAGGCLPMLLQMPFMIALYFALQGMIELRHAPFMLWIDDLSAPEDFVSLAGVPIRPLPLLMGGSMILQQYLTPSTGDAQQDQQRQMMMMMSLVFIVLFYQFASGLVLYWFVSNLLGIGQQLLVNRQKVLAT